MHVRMNMLAGDPARLGEATRYLEEPCGRTWRPSTVTGAWPASPTPT